MTQNVTPAFTTHLFVVGILALLMLAPLKLLHNIVNERSDKHQANIDKISMDWGKRQTLQGPILIIPYIDHIIDIDTITDKHGETNTVTRNTFNNKTLIVLPDDLNINVNLRSQQQQQSIYKTPVYIADLSLSGSFDYGSAIGPLTENQNNNRRYQWDRAQILIGLTDTKGIMQNSLFKWDDQSTSLRPGTKLTDLLSMGVSAHLKDFSLDKLNTEHEFKLQLTFKGSQGFHFTPLGKVTKAHITSTLAFPKLHGDISPSEYKANDGSHSAKWEVLYLARDYPQQWIIQDEKYQIDQFTAGITLSKPEPSYSNILHAIQYGLALIALTFLALLLIELSTKTHLHKLQYIVIASLLCLFYFVLVSLAEYMIFLYAYLSATAITVIIISLYILNLLKEKWHTITIAGVLTTLFATLYALIHMEDQILLINSAVLLLTAMAVMFFTRKI